MELKITTLFCKAALISLLAIPVLGHAQKAYDSPDAAPEELDPMVATTPRMYLERSTVLSFDRQFRAYRVPTVDANGVVRYLDITVTLTPGATGIPAATAAVSSVLSPNIVSNAIVPGTYKYLPVTATNVDSCVVSNVALTGGRSQSFFSCADNGRVMEMSVATGPITAGHPFLTELQYANAHTRSDAANYFWGKVTASDSTRYLGSCGFYYEDIVGIKQVNNQIIIYNFDNGSNSAGNGVDCSVTLLRQ
ncbi:MAG: hypothetical protein IPK63_07325 [Candidatus Competibacteraceae bacterium]|nr:hypothetical protein [Candidatus Competibacteraceae bacterium]